MKFPSGYKLIIFLNYLPFLFIVAAAAGMSFWGFNIWALLAWLYLAPPIFSRIVFRILGKPHSQTPALSKEFFAWWISLQMQIIFIRLPLLEEILRLVPGLYSNWLRLWGAAVGKYVYWGAALRVMDRPFLRIGDFAVIGYGAGFTAHHFQIFADGRIEFVFGLNIVGERAVMGGESGLGPGSEVAPSETLPSTIGLAPNSIWKGGRKYRQNSEEAAP